VNQNHAAPTTAAPSIRPKSQARFDSSSNRPARLVTSALEGSAVAAVIGAISVDVTLGLAVRVGEAPGVGVPVGRGVGVALGA
jgi:hypothetical protein